MIILDVRLIQALTQRLDTHDTCTGVQQPILQVKSIEPTQNVLHCTAT